MQEFVTRLRMHQKHRSGVYETQLFPLVLRGDFPDSLIVPDKIPKIKWKPIWEPPTDIKMSRVIDLYNNMLMGDVEARAELGMPEAIKGNLKQQPTQTQEPEQNQQDSTDRFNVPQGLQKQGLPVKLVKTGNGASYLVRALL
jgi:hypothetical protein